MEANTKNQFWDLKPAWCQPWTIITFGILVLILIWTVFHNITITLVCSSLVVLWWILFLFLVPISFQKSSKENRLSSD
tara:strand:+ start:139 stop:372 length:234 start_codon:yes stop_codon:yes gene_type:complete